jgi:RimJ/RimL family protein N-acetyltransferase
MTDSIWQGELIRLRAVEPEDWQEFHAWNADTEVARLCYFIPFPSSTEAQRQRAQETAQSQGKDDAFDFVIETLEGEFVGSINTHHCERRNGTFQYGVAIRREHWRRGYASEAIRLVLRYFFDELGYQKVTVHTYDFNSASIQLHEKMGFTHEGRLRRMAYTDGAYHDDVVLGMTAEEFRGKYPRAAIDTSLS